MALMNVLSKPDTASDFIHRLEDETYYSQEVFDHYKAIYDSAEKDLDEQEEEKVKQLLVQYNICPPVRAKKLMEYILSEAYGSQEEGQRVPVDYGEFKRILEKETHFRKQFQQHLENWLAIHHQREEQGYLERSTDMGLYVSDMDLAIATYVVFQQSRDGMGQTWSAQKFKTNAQYKQQLIKLYDCAERLEGVAVSQIDAMYYFINLASENIDKTDLGFSTMSEWISDSRVMMCCDPSYISADHEEKLLEGIDVDSVDSLSEAISEKYKGGRMPRNLGKVYARSFGYDEQERFVKCIQNAKCKMMVSNYDLVLYNKYLNEKTGWRKEMFETTTGVGSKKDNKRTEVIWYNY